MPKEAIILLALIIMIFILGLIITIIKFKNINQLMTKKIDGYTIEIKTTVTKCTLKIDDRIVDSLKSIRSYSCKLMANLQGKNIIVNISSGFLKTKIITYIDGIKDDELSNY